MLLLVLLYNRLSHCCDYCVPNSFFAYSASAPEKPLWRCNYQIWTKEKKNYWKSLFLCILKYWSIDLSNLLQNFNSFLAIDAPCSLSKRNPINSSVNPHFTWWLRLMAEHPIHIKRTYSRSSKTYRIKACIHTEPCPSAKSITWSAQIWSQTVSNWDVN